MLMIGLLAVNLTSARLSPRGRWGPLAIDLLKFQNGRRSHPGGPACINKEYRITEVSLFGASPNHQHQRRSPSASLKKGFWARRRWYGPRAKVSIVISMLNAPRPWIATEYYRRPYKHANHLAPKQLNPGPLKRENCTEPPQSSLPPKFPVRSRSTASSGWMKTSTVFSRCMIVPMRLPLIAFPSPMTRPEIISSPRKNKRKKFEEFLFRVGTHNWNGNANIGIASRETYYNRKNFDIIAVTETRMNPRINGKFRSGKYKWFGCANEDGHGGVGFLVGLHLAPYVTVLKHSFKNQLWIRIAASRGTDADMFLCAAYMPQESALLADADAAWAALAEAWTKYSTKGVVAVLGDLNAKPAVPENEIEARLFGSNYPDGHRSRNGRLLARMVAQVGAVVLNGHSTRRDGQPWTTFSRFNESAQREIRSMLDFILVAPELRIQNCKSEFGVDDVDLDSDHYLTWARLRCPRKRDGRRRKPAHKRFKLHLLKPTHRPHHKAPPSAQSSQASPASSQSPPLSPASAPPTSQQNSKDDPSEQHRDHYEAKLIDAFEGFELPVPDHLTSEEDRVSAADEAVGDFIQRTFTALRSSVGEQTVNPRFSRSWFDQECRSAIDQRRRIYRLYKAAPTTESWQRYKCERLRVRRLIRRKKQEDWEKFLKSLADDFGTNMKGCWSKVNRLLPKSAKSGSHPIRMANGLLASSHSDRLSAAASYREELGRALYRPTFDAGFKAQAEEEVERMLFDSPLQEDDADLDGTISPDEVKAVLARAATGKAAGKDQTRNSMFKYGGATMVDQLTELFNWLRELEVTPSDWGHAVIINLFKDGDPADMGNYRGISLISCLGKLYLGVWALVLQPLGTASV